MANEIQSITIEYDNDESAMYGSNGAEGYDAMASEMKYEEMLTAALQEAYPDVEIEVTTGYGRVMVDGDTAHEEVDTVNQILHKVWSSFDWLVDNATV